MQDLILRATRDFQFLGLKKGDMIKLVYDEEIGYYHAGHCTWSPKRINDEIALKLWEVVDQDFIEIQEG